MPAWRDDEGNAFYYRFERDPETNFLLGQDPDDNPRVKYGVMAIQRELAYLGYDSGRVDGAYSWGTKTAVRNLQQLELDWTKRHSDGAVGPKTARELFIPRTERLERRFDIPYCLLAGQVALESAWDPGATGYVDPADRGLCQINARAHPDITDEQAFDPGFALKWSAKLLSSRVVQFLATTNGDMELALDCALAAHNNPTKAAAWAEAGDPPDSQIEQYVALVKQRASAECVEP